MAKTKNRTAEKDTTVGGRKSILSVYEQKLSYTKGQPMWKTWLETRPSTSSESKSVEMTSFHISDENSVPPKEVKIEMGETKFRDIRCCKCSCIGNIHLVERTEEVLDILRSCCYT